ncbi:MAG: SDR family oxidoreductase [Erythrobacter sp.]|jgi:3-oxoacyl-[acyl-carrier protein] reductase|uniref:SDR family NAD(P)-dependent oxidoreductase n=1 Tax=Qipengyuania citrea TaxID=225971 RepID=UPI00209D5A1C|nr:SDR family oxidoreductase [Qipengyuania citrea]MCP2018895.1 3-oxoacyl-[acyl-carrier protein] reductase [Qipengyuania citrea]MDE0902236.1 SDR family oxidoreductase [Erythrobacter sp.]
MTDPLDFSGKTVLVIGGSSGIGNGIAHGFRQHGALVHVTGTRAAASEYTASEGSDLAGLTFHRLDVSDASATASFALPGRLDVVVLCQGTVRYRREEFEREGWDAVMEVNLNSLMDCARIVRPRLAEQGGSLIVVSSVGAYHAMLGNPAYAASKAGAVSLVGSLAQAWAGEGIRVNGIAPGLVPTKLTKVTTENEQRAAGAVARIPAGRMGTPQDMAGAALFLASPLADYIVGQTIRVDGGMTLA